MKTWLLIKTFGLMLAVAVIFGLGFERTAMATSIDLDVTVNPNYGSFYSGSGDTTGVARYTFRIEPTSSLGAKSFMLWGSERPATKVKFESDIFASIDNLTLLSGPAGFTLSKDESALDVTIVEGFGTLLPGEFFQFTVDYTLTDSKAFFLEADPADPNGWKWSMDGSAPWHQSVTATYGDPSTFTLVSDGGSTSVPEPTSLILLGGGLIGLGLWRHQRS